LPDPAASIGASRTRLSPLARRFIVRTLLGMFIVGLGLSAPGTVPGLPPGCYPPPVDAPVAVPYRAPACRYCAGHRGIDFATAPGAAVRALAEGVVSFAGSVAGTSYVVVDQRDGRRATYGRVERVAVRVGDPVRAGDRMGSAAGQVYIGLRVGDDYIDPTPLIGRLRRAARLVPLDGSGRPPAPAARLECPKQPGAG
jgi:hypothetical protein